MARDSWVVIGLPSSRTNGGSARASLLFEQLAAATRAKCVHGPPSRNAPLWLGPNVARGRRTVLASMRLVSAAFRHLPDALLNLRVIDLADHPVLQAQALGVHLEPAYERQLTQRFRFACEAFEHITTVSESCIGLWGLPEDRVILVSNGSDPRVIRRHPLPQRPVVGVASGAAPGRGLELLVDAAVIARARLPELRLSLALTATGDASSRYLNELRSRWSRMAWIDFREDLAFEEIDDFLAGVTVVASTLPPSPYFDAALPVKIFDAFAAGRPVVTTPRLESAQLIQSRGVGLVADDTAEGVADRILQLMSDSALLEAMSVRARLIAEAEFDLRVLGAKLVERVMS